MHTYGTLLRPVPQLFFYPHLISFPMTVMTAIVFDRPGAPEVLRYREVPRPVPSVTPTPIVYGRNPATARWFNPPARKE